eukprot:3565447-Prymnesium_polylepis.1
MTAGAGGTTDRDPRRVTRRGAAGRAAGRPRTGSYTPMCNEGPLKAQNRQCPNAKRPQTA